MRRSGVNDKFVPDPGITQTLGDLFPARGGEQVVGFTEQEEYKGTQAAMAGVSVSVGSGLLSGMSVPVSQPGQNTTSASSGTWVAPDWTPAGCSASWEDDTARPRGNLPPTNFHPSSATEG
jgi:hypothetical protein